MMAVPNAIPCLRGRELEYLSECIKTGWVSSVGPFVDRFERVFADYHGVAAAVSASTGTAAIHLALLEIGVKPGDLVLCPTMTFVGTANPIRYCGADAVFLDSDPATLNLDPGCLVDFLERHAERTPDGVLHRDTRRRIAAVVAVHLYGNPADLGAIMAIAGRYGVPVIEDAAESLGALYHGKRVGTLGEMGCFSFNGNKIITTGGGGMLIGRDVGKVRHAKHLSTTARCDTFDFVHDEVAYNYRLSNVCAAVGVAQMERLDEFIACKRKNAASYATAFSRTGRWTVIREPSGTVGTYWMVLARPTDAASVSFETMRACAARGIGVRPIWRPLHTMPAYQQSLYFGGEVAVKLHQSVFCLPSSVSLSEEDIHTTVTALDALPA